MVKNINVDFNEVSKFDEMAQYWWDQEGPLQSLHQLNPIRLGFIQSYASLANSRILDIGCGGGILSEALSQFSTQVYGIDQAEKALEVAIQHSLLLAYPPIYELTTSEEYAKRFPDTFDIITCMEMLEHVPSPEKILLDCATLLKPGGDLFVSTLNRTPKAFLFAILGAEYFLKILPKGTHEYAKFIRPSELEAFARKHGLTLHHIQGISYKPLSKHFTLSSDVSINYLAHFKKESA